jgi:hypothetical protein
VFGPADGSHSNGSVSVSCGPNVPKLPAPFFEKNVGSSSDRATLLAPVTSQVSLIELPGLLNGAPDVATTGQLGCCETPKLAIRGPVLMAELVVVWPPSLSGVVVVDDGAELTRAAVAGALLDGLVDAADDVAADPDAWPEAPDEQDEIPAVASTAMANKRLRARCVVTR